MYVGWNEFDRILGSMHQLRNRFDCVFSDFDRGYASRPWSTMDKQQKIKLHDTGDNLEVVAELPGITKEDLHVKIQGNYLEISGSRKNDTPEGYKVHRKERHETTFSRSFTLPYEVDADKVEANLTNGVLTMTLPKADAAKAKQITVH